MRNWQHPGSSHLPVITAFITATSTKDSWRLEQVCPDSTRCSMLCSTAPTPVAQQLPKATLPIVKEGKRLGSGGFSVVTAVTVLMAGGSQQEVACKQFNLKTDRENRQFMSQEVAAIDKVFGCVPGASHHFVQL